MYNFGSRSKRYLDEVHPALVLVAKDVIRVYDFGVLTGFRGREEQNEKFRQGLSTVAWPDSNHNGRTGGLPSFAIDVAPYHKKYRYLTGHPEQIEKIAEDLKAEGHKEPEKEAYAFIREQYALLWGLFLAFSTIHGVNLRWGGDWDRDNDTIDQNFDDLMHIELGDPVRS